MSVIDKLYERRRFVEKAASIPAVLAQVAGLASVLSLSAFLNTWNLAQNGYGNTFYAAAVRSMMQSWHNFFFASYDPGGFITVDKPPVFLWMGALSARVFGYSSWSILLPSAIAGVASVGLLWLIVRRYFGVTAATIAGLALALSPISVAVDRLNLPEPFLILVLTGAAGAILRSLESRRWWAWTALAGFLVGIAFNIKMLDGWIPGPALALALVVALPALSRTSLRQLAARLAILGAVTLVVSASWLVVVDAWPASDRPYIGGSTNNTVLDLALGYNGFGRVDGAEGTGGGARPPSNAAGPQHLPAGTTDGRAQIPRMPSAPPGGQGAPGALPATRGQAPPTGTGSPGGFRGAGGIIAGIPSLLRMLDDANGGQIGWLLPFALGGGLLALWSWRRDPVRRAFAVLFLGWVLLYGGIFSYAQGIYHSYYTSAMAPAVAVLVGVGTVAAANAIRRDPRWLFAVVGLIGLTLWTQLQIAGRTPDFYGWVRPLTIATALAGVAGVAVLAVRRLPAASGLIVSVAGLLLLPAAWSWSASANAALNATLPQAGPHEGASGGTFGSQAFDAGTPELAEWLKSHSDADASWQLVVSSSQEASKLIAEYGVSVMPLGGFMGTDNTISVAGFADLVSSGAVRYVLVGQGGTFGRALLGAGAGARLDDGGRQGMVLGGFDGVVTSGPNAVMSAVQGACTLVSDPPVRYQNALYDCAGKADTIHERVP